MTARVDAQAAPLYVWWCPICQKQTERQWHLYRRGPALIPQLDEEHMCERVEVVRAGLLADAEKALRDASDCLRDLGYSRYGEYPLDELLARLNAAVADLCGEREGYPEPSA